MQDFCSASEDQETELLRMFCEAWAGCIGRVKSCLLFELASIRLHTRRVPQFLQKRTHGNSFGLAEDRPIYIYLSKEKAQAFIWSVREVYPALNIHGTASKSQGECRLVQGLDKSKHINTWKLCHLPSPWCNISSSPSTGVDLRNLFLWGHWIVMDRSVVLYPPKVGKTMWFRENHDFCDFCKAKVSHDMFAWRMIVELCWADMFGRFSCQRKAKLKIQNNLIEKVRIQLEGFAPKLADWKIVTLQTLHQ